MNRMWALGQVLVNGQQPRKQMNVYLGIEVLLGGNRMEKERS